LALVPGVLPSCGWNVNSFVTLDWTYAGHELTVAKRHSEDGRTAAPSLSSGRPGAAGKDDASHRAATARLGLGPLIAKDTLKELPRRRGSGSRGGGDVPPSQQLGGSCSSWIAVVVKELLEQGRFGDAEQLHRAIKVFAGLSARSDRPVDVTAAPAGRSASGC